MSDTPTRLIKPPYRDKSGCRDIYPTDIGEMTLAQISRATGIAGGTIYCRLRQSWDRLDLFDRARQIKNTYRQGGNAPLTLGADGDLVKLSGKSRVKNLYKIKVGTWEEARL